MTAIDHLSALVADDMDLTGFVLSEGQWLTENIKGDLPSQPDIHAYVGAMADLVQALIDDGDTSGRTAAVIATRSPLGSPGRGGRGNGESPHSPYKPVVVKGKGDQKTKPFTMPGGDFTVVMSGAGGGNVTAELDERGSDYNELLINEISYKEFRYETALYDLSPGSYYLDAGVDGECAWTLTFTPLG